MAPPKNRRGNLDFPAMVGGGENPNGFRAATANGTASDQGEGDNQDPWKYRMQQDGPRWNGGTPDSFVTPAMPGRKRGQTNQRGNRTGE